MKGFLLFACLLCLLEGNHISTILRNTARPAPAAQVEKKQSEKLTDVSHGYAFLQDTGVYDENLLGEDVEDDRANQLVKKYKTLTRWYLTVPHAVQLNNLYGSMIDRLSFSGQLPDIYLAQRALRI